MKINICTGYPLSSPKGNSVTAIRFAQLFRERGHEAAAMHTNEPPSADVNISLHALKTSAATLHFAKHNPEGIVIVLLTGTDIHGGIEGNAPLAKKIFEVSDAFVVAQSACIKDLPEPWQAKVHTIYPSVDLVEPEPIVAPPPPLFTNIGHLRPVKNPHLMFKAIREIRNELTAVSIGTDLDTTDGQQAIINSRIDPRYRWIGVCSRGATLNWMRHSTATINTSFSEGGANTIIESILLDVPVLASFIAGNRGILGEDYAGFFPSNDAVALAKLMVRCLDDSDFVDQLKHQIRKRAPLFTNEAEAAGWLSLIELIKNES